LIATRATKPFNPPSSALKTPEASMSEWTIYMIRTKYGALYTGITQNVKRRFAEHSEGGRKGAKYLKGRGPLKLVFQQKIGSRSEALKAEAAIKKMSKQEKEGMVNKFSTHVSSI
jgi:putative endonuclease